MWRSVRLFRLFLSEQSDPDGFYAALASDAAGQLAPYTTVRGQTVLDIGGGAGYFTEEFRSRGAHCYLLELSVGEMMSRGQTPPGAVVADGYWLPRPRRRRRHLPVLQRPRARQGPERADRGDGPGHQAWRPDLPVVHELVLAVGRPRDRRPGTTSARAWRDRRYRRKHGKPPKHQVGSQPVPAARRARAADGARRVRRRSWSTARPRYYPRWCRALLLIPGLREIATWNLLLILRRTG